VNTEPLRRVFTENRGLKITSLLIAVLLWMFVIGEKQSDVELTVPLSLVNLSSDLVITSRVPGSVSVRVTGPRTIVASISPKQYGLTMDLKGIQPGTSSFEILPSRFGFPRGVEVTGISPSVVTIVADRTGYKSLAVKPRFKGVPAEGYEVAGVEVSPPEITVAASERVLKIHKELSTEVIDLSGIDGGITRVVQPVFPDPSFRRVDDRPVNVKVRVQKIAAEREFIAVPVAPPSGGWVIEPGAVDVRLGVSVGVLSGFSARDIRVTVRPPPAGEDYSEVVVELPEGARLLSVTPEKVRIRQVK
jgi:YbbR domain-containing protein